MSEGGRFEKLEGGGGLPGDVKKAIDRLSRFDNLEIGEPQPHPHLPPAEPKALCLHCGQDNEKERELCWACSRPMAPKPEPKPAASAAEHEIVLVLDGVTYKSSDPALPRDVGALMDRIKKEGYSPELLAQWRQWRATRNVQPLKPQPAAAAAPPEMAGSPAEVEVFKGVRTSVMKIDGKVYTSDSGDLSPELKVLLNYVDVNGVTPALLDYLRQFGHRVKYRPANTTDPSEGEIAFWEGILKKQGIREDADKTVVQRSVAEAHAREILRRERETRSSGGETSFAVKVALAVVLYIIARILFDR